MFFSTDYCSGEVFIVIILQSIIRQKMIIVKIC